MDDIIEPTDPMLQTRGMREAGIALITTSTILAVFLFIPLSPGSSASSQVAAVADTVASTTLPVIDAFASTTVEAQAAIVYDLATSETLYAKNADAQLPLASLTKLLTVYTAFTRLPHNAQITISGEAVQAVTPRAFNKGQVFALSDLARLTLTASLNDGAVAIAEAAADRDSQSTKQALSGVANDLNLTQTYVLNGSGLDISSATSGGYGSARDVARLAGALVEQAPGVADATTHATAQAVSRGGTKLKVKNTDPIVESIPHLLLSKTGYTDLAGGNLALVFDVGIGHPIGIVVLGSTLDGRFADGTALVDATLAHFAGVAPIQHD